jgi:hypothetical protein
MDTAAAPSNSSLAPMTSASATAAPVRRPQSSNIASMNAPAATRIPPSLQAKMAAVRTPLLSTPLHSSPRLDPEINPLLSLSRRSVCRSPTCLPHPILTRLALKSPVFTQITTSPFPSSSIAPATTANSVDATVNGFIRMNLADRPPFPLAPASTPGMGAHGVASRRLGRPGLKLSDIEGMGSGAKAAGLAQGRPSALPPPRKPPPPARTALLLQTLAKLCAFLSVSNLPIFIPTLQRSIRCLALHRQGCTPCKGR